MGGGAEAAVSQPTLDGQEGVGGHGLAEQVPQLALLGRAQRVEATRRRPHEVVGPLLDSRALGGQRHGLDPPVGRMGASLGQPGALEVVHERGDVGPVEAEVGGQLAHGGRRVGRQVDEGLEHARWHTGVGAHQLHPVARLPLEDESVDHRPTLPSHLGAHW